MEIIFTKDYALIHDIMTQAFKEYGSTPALYETPESIEAQHDHGEKTLAAQQNDETVGIVRFEIVDDTLYFYRLSVVPAQRGKGIATALIERVERYAQEQDITKISCKVRLDSDKNTALFETVGYQICDKHNSMEPDTTTFVCMKKTI